MQVQRRLGNCFLSRCGRANLWRFRWGHPFLFHDYALKQYSDTRYNGWHNDEWEWSSAVKIEFFRPSVTKSGRPYGVMYVLSWCTPGGTPNLTKGGQPGITLSGNRITWLDGRGRSAFTLTKRTCFLFDLLARKTLRILSVSSDCSLQKKKKTRMEKIRNRDLQKQVRFGTRPRCLSTRTEIVNFNAEIHLTLHSTTDDSSQKICKLQS